MADASIKRVLERLTEEAAGLRGRLVALRDRATDARARLDEVRRSLSQARKPTAEGTAEDGTPGSSEPQEEGPRI